MLNPHPLRSCVLAAVLLGLGTACEGPKLTPDQTMALRQAQTRNFEVPLDTVFRATTAYLQDNFYQIRQVSKSSGIINAYKAQDLSGSEKFWGACFAGAAAKKGDTYDVTFTFEAFDESNTQVRCNITHGVSNMAGMQGDVKAVTDPMLYKSMLDALNVEVQRRHMATTMRQTKDVPVPDAAPDPGE